MRVLHKPQVMVCLLATLASLDGGWCASPALSLIYPRGGARGATISVEFNGSNLADAVDLLFHDEGISLATLSAVDSGKVRCVLDIAPDAPLGNHRIRVRTQTGISDLKIFSVGNLKELFEVEPNNDADQPQAVAVDTTVNGTIENEDADFFAVDLKAGERIAVEVEALRLGGQLFDPKLRLFSPKGHELVAVDDMPLTRQDAAFSHVATETGTHLVALSESTYGGAGDYYYRLHVGRFPRPLTYSPMGVVPGASVEIKWLGDPGLASQTITAPTGAPGTTISLSVVTESGSSPSSVPFRLSQSPSVREAEPNNAPEQPTWGAAPGAFEGILETPGDEDWFAFKGTTGQELSFRVFARRFGSPLDSVLIIRSPSGNQIAGEDDNVGQDSAATLGLPEDGTYTLRVRDHLGGGGPLFAYRVEVQPPTTRMTLNLLENEPAKVAVPKGNRAHVLVNVSRERFDGPVQFSAPGLPAGAALECDTLPAGESVLPLVFSAVDEATPAGVLSPLEGTYVSDENKVTGELDQKVVLVYGDNKTIFHEEPLDRLALAVTDRAPFDLELVPPTTPIVQNGAKDLVVRTKRAEGFADEIALTIPWRPSGVGAGTATIPAGATQSTIRIDAGSGAPPQTRNLIVAGTSAGFQICTKLTPVSISQPWVTFEVPEIATDQGKPVDMTVKLNQAVPYEGTFHAELLGFPKGVTTATKEFTKETAEIVFPLTVAEDAPEGKHEGLFVLAILSASGEEVLHQWGGGKLTIQKPLPPTLQEAPPPVAEQPKPEEPQRKTRFPTS